MRLRVQWPPNLERAVPSCHREVTIGCQQCQIVPDAKLRQQRVNRTELNPRTPTVIAQFCGIDIVPPIRNKQWERRKSLHEILARARSRETLQQFLQYKSGGDDRFAAVKSGLQCRYLRGG